MPPRVIKQRGGRAVVSQTHPAATAAAAAAAAARVGASAEKINGGKVSASKHDSPLRAAKTLAQEKISEMCHHNPRAAVAEEAPDDLMLLPALPRALPRRHTHPCGTRGGVGHVPPCISLVTVGN